MEIDILNALSEGAIVIDANGTVQAFNRKAKTIFGIEDNSSAVYDSGKLENEDVVIIAVSSFGQDDGVLNSQTLRKINVREIPSAGDAFVAIGKMNSQSKAISKSFEQNGLGKKFEITQVYDHRRVSVQIDQDHRSMDIIVDGRNFQVQYIQSFAHMVVIDGQTGQIKFVQSHGYSFRKESVGDLLRGRFFQGNGSENQVDLVGRKLADVLNEPEIVERLINAAQGQFEGFESQYMNIHARPVLCSVRKIESESKLGYSMLVVEDVSEFNLLIRERNNALQELDSIRKKLITQFENDPLPEIVGSSISMNRVKKMAKSASQSKSTVLILGESGTGKNLIAEAIHKNSDLAQSPFIQVNCGALPENLIESELFGYAPGAFSGAGNKGKAGFFELASGGTLFLDEVGELPLHVQVKLLHAIQNNQFYQVGGTKLVEVNVRLIAATNKNLDVAVQNGQFREDLFYRLNVLRILVPPLRERREDIQELAQVLMPQIGNRLGIQTTEVSTEALYTLRNHRFPGNVRELENILERALNLSEGNLILKEHLLLDKFGQIGDTINTMQEMKPLREVLQETEKKTIMQALELFEGDREGALKSLKIGKSSFYEKIKKYDIKI